MREPRRASGEAAPAREEGKVRERSRGDGPAAGANTPPTEYSFNWKRQPCDWREH